MGYLECFEEREVPLINSFSIEIFIASNKKGLSYVKKLGVSFFFKRNLKGFI